MSETRSGRPRRQHVGNARQIGESFFVRLPRPPGKGSWSRWDVADHRHIWSRSYRAKGWLRRARIRVYERRPELPDHWWYPRKDYPELEVLVTATRCDRERPAYHVLEAVEIFLWDSRIVEDMDQIVRAEVERPRDRKLECYVDVVLRPAR